MNNKDRQTILKLIAETDLITGLVYRHEFDSFKDDEKAKRTVCMTLLNIGELAESLSGETRKMNLKIPWYAITGLREVIAHRYRAVIIGDIWSAAQFEIPKMRKKLKNIYEKRDL